MEEEGEVGWRDGKKCGTVYLTTNEKSLWSKTWRTTNENSHNPNSQQVQLPYLSLLLSKAFDELWIH